MNYGRIELIPNIFFNNVILWPKKNNYLRISFPKYEEQIEPLYTGKVLYTCFE